VNPDSQQTGITALPLTTHNGLNQGVSKLLMMKGHTHSCGMACHHAKCSWVSKRFMTKGHNCNCELVRGPLTEN